MATFNRRKTDIPSAVPLGLTAEFGNDETKARQWRLYLESLGVEAVVDLPTVISRITDYVLPASKFAAQSSDRKT